MYWKSLSIYGALGHKEGMANRKAWPTNGKLGIIYYARGELDKAELVRMFQGLLTFMVLRSGCSLFRVT